MAHVVANSTCTTALSNGVRIRLQQGHIHSDDEQIVRERPDLFDPLAKPAVEQTTRAPGEKRTTRAKPKG
jgi:hypothetical protein